MSKIRSFGSVDIQHGRGHSELANLRLVNKAVRSSTTPRLFWKVNATITIESTEDYKQGR